MLMFRVQKQNRWDRGMYWSMTSSNMRGDYNRHPSPSMDSKMKDALKHRGYLDVWQNFRAPHMYFGFANLEQFASWVYQKEWWHSLDDEGYHMAVYDVPDQECIVGYTQMCAHITGLSPIAVCRVSDWQSLTGLIAGEQSVQHVQD